MNPENKAGIIVGAIAIIVLGSLGFVASWDARDAEADKFARECNKKGGTARVIDGMRQCLRAAAPPEGNENET